MFEFIVNVEVPENLSDKEFLFEQLEGTVVSFPVIPQLGQFLETEDGWVYEITSISWKLPKVNLERPNLETLYSFTAELNSVVITARS